MTSYRILIFLHVTAVIVGLGVTFVYPFLQAFSEKRGVGAVRLSLQFGKWLEDHVVWPGAALVLLFGIGLIFSDQTGYKDDMPAWLSAALVIYILALVVAWFVQRRNVKNALAALEGVADDAPLPAAYVAVGKKLQMVGGTLGLAIVVITFLMTYKPGA